MRIEYYEHSTELFPATCGEVLEWPNMGPNTGCVSHWRGAGKAEHGLRITLERCWKSRTRAAYHIGEVLEWPNRAAC
jgi:hypothetical protein